MGAIHPPTVVDRHGITWTWEDLRSAYLAPGQMPHGIETLRIERGPLTVPWIWSDDAEGYQPS